MSSSEYRPPAPSSAREPAPTTPAPRVYRKLTKNGNSLTVAIPGVFLRALSLLPTDVVELVLDREWGGFFVRPVAPRTTHHAPAADAPPLSDVA